MKQSERVKAMEENFIDRRRAKISIRDIAKEFKLNVCTVYAHLDEIAMKAGVSREALLYQPHQTYSKNTKEPTHPRKTCSVDPDDVRQDFNELLEKMDGILNKMNELLEEE